MKKLAFLYVLSLSTLFTSCTGPAGIDGRDGIDGKDGGIEYAKILQFTADFNEDNGYAETFVFPNNVEVFKTDVIMVYIKWKEETLNSGEVVNVWRALPQTTFMNDGSFVYNFDYTYVDIKMFLEGNYDYATLNDDYSKNQVFRVAIIPAENAVSMQYDFSSLPAVMQNMNITTKDIVTIPY